MLFKRKPAPTILLLSFSAMIGANLIWAAAGPVIKYTIAYIPPFTFLFMRFLIVCILLLPYVAVELTKNKINPGDYLKVMLLGIFSQSSIIFIFLGLKYTTAVDAAIIGAIGVLLSMAAGHYFFNEKMHTGVKIGLILALLGSMVVILEPMLSEHSSAESIQVTQRIWGNVLVFFNNLAFLLYIIWSKISMGKTNNVIKKTLSFIHMKPMQKAYSAAQLTAISFYVGMASMLPFALLENLGYLGPVEYNMTQIPVTAYLGLGFMAIFSSIVAYFLFEWALDVVSVGDTAILGYTSAIFGIPFAYLMLGEIPSTFGIIGGTVIGIGVVIAEIAGHLHKKTALKRAAVSIKQ